MAGGRWQRIARCRVGAELRSALRDSGWIPQHPANPGEQRWRPLQPGRIRRRAGDTHPKELLPEVQEFLGRKASLGGHLLDGHACDQLLRRVCQPVKVKGRRWLSSFWRHAAPTGRKEAVHADRTIPRLGTQRHLSVRSHADRPSLAYSSSVLPCNAARAPRTRSETRRSSRSATSTPSAWRASSPSDIAFSRK